jgi:endonuclease YncB( thermonuclease family)
MKKLFFLIIFIVYGNASALSMDALVIKISDGDTVTVLDKQNITHKIRLQGIDAPEKKQAYGEKSKQSLAFLVSNKWVLVDYTKHDKYGRIIGKLTLGGKDICLQQIAAGMAWHYKKYQNEQTQHEINLYDQAEIQSRNSKIGLWSDKNPIPPWDFRKNK